MRYLLLVLALVALPTVSSAQTESNEDFSTDSPQAPRNWSNLRGGVTTTSRGKPEICLEIAPLSFLSLESCGTGSGILHHDPETELAHFRTKIGPSPIQRGKVWVQPQVALGFAELQVGNDEEGFDFSGPGPTGVETAGPEVGASLKVLVPMTRGVELVGDVQANAAWMEHAPELNEPQNKLQSSFIVTMGVGF